jgi:DUF971 family protein
MVIRVGSIKAEACGSAVQGSGIKVGKLDVDSCGIGAMGSDIEIGEAKIANTGIGLWDGRLHPLTEEEDQQPAKPSRLKRAAKGAARFLRDASAATIAAVIGAIIKPS